MKGRKRSQAAEGHCLPSSKFDRARISQKQHLIFLNVQKYGVSVYRSRLTLDFGVVFCFFVRYWAFAAEFLAVFQLWQNSLLLRM